MYIYTARFVSKERVLPTLSKKKKMNFTLEQAMKAQRGYNEPLAWMPVKCPLTIVGRGALRSAV
jgi:hypothetical protein